MSDTPSPPAAPESSVPAEPRRPWYHWKRWGFNFLTVSIAAHLFFGVGAAYLIVQTIQPRRKQTFTAPSSGPNAPTHAMEHKVQMQKQRRTASAPVSLKRVTTTSHSKVALPAMPDLPKDNSAITPMIMAGMGGSGLGLGTGGSGSGGSGGGNGGGLSAFGLRDNRGGALTGTFFDLKQTSDHRTTSIARDGADGRLTPEASKEYTTAVEQFVTGGMNDGSLASRYFKGPIPLYTTQIFIPVMPADEGPKAFNLAGMVKPSRWIVHYRGTVVPPESGSYHFVGVADDVLVVRFNGNIVLDCGSLCPSGRTPARYYESDGLHPKGWFHGSGEGSAFNVEAGHPYPIDIVIGEWPGSAFMAWLQIRKDGVEYKKDSHGNPILPLFRLTGGKTPPTRSEAPVYEPDGPIWKGMALATSPP